jgi:hypothetical protein
MEKKQFDEILNELQNLKTENFNLKKDIKLIKNIVVGVSIYGLTVMTAYGLGAIFGLINRFF